MIGDITWKVNGIDLDTALGAYLTDATFWRPPVSVRRTIVSLPGVHGVITPGLPVLDEPQLQIEPRWNCANQAELEEKVNHARALLTQPTLTLTRVSGGLETSAVAELVSISDGAFLVGSTASMMAILAVPAGMFRSAVSTSPDVAFATDLTNVEIAGLSGSSGPIPDPIIRITGPATQVSVTDPLTGTGLSWAGTLPAGSYLFLRPRPLMARISTSADAWLAGGTHVVDGVDYPATGRLQMWPAVQTATSRKVLLSATGAGRTAATKLAVQAQGSYL